MTDAYTTHRVSFASFLRYSGIPHVSTVKISSKVVQFAFYDPENQCRRLELEFLSGCAVADAMELLEADRDLKRTIKFASENGRWDAHTIEGESWDS